MDFKTYSNWYPPSKYVFMPIYKASRKKFKNKYLALTLTYGSSVAIHGLPFFFF